MVQHLTQASRAGFSRRPVLLGCHSVKVDGWRTKGGLAGCTVVWLGVDRRLQTVVETSSVPRATQWSIGNSLKLTDRIREMGTWCHQCNSSRE